MMYVVPAEIYATIHSHRLTLEHNSLVALCQVTKRIAEGCEKAGDAELLDSLTNARWGAGLTPSGEIPTI